MTDAFRLSRYISDKALVLYRMKSNIADILFHQAFGVREHFISFVSIWTEKFFTGRIKFFPKLIVYAYGQVDDSDSCF